MMQSFLRNALRRACLFAGLLACCAIAYAHHTTGYGVKAGFNLASVGGEEFVNDNVRPTGGFHLGLFVNSAVTDRFALQPEFVLSSQGYQVETGNALELENEGDLTQVYYLNLPVMAKYSVLDRLELMAGPQIGVALFDNISGDGPLNRADFAIGGGAVYQMGSGLRLGVRYNHGVSDIHSNYTMRNRVVQFSVGYLFKKYGDEE